MNRLVAAALLCAACATTPAAAPSATPPAPPASPAQAAPAKPAAAPPDDGTPVTCTGAITGAVRGQFPCRVTVSIEGATATFKVEPLAAVAGVRTLVPAAFELSTPLRAQAYARDAITAGEAVVELSGGQRYTASSRRGEVALTLDSAERYKQARNFYVVSGTLIAHLVADGGALGEVVLELRF